MDLVMTLCRPIMVMAQGRLLMSRERRRGARDPRVIEAYLGGAVA